MSKKRIGRYRTLLESRRAAIEKDLAEARRERERLAAVSAPDEVDAAALAAERELAIANIDRLSRILRQLKSAQQRLADGTYGTCLDCEEPIPETRLNAVPWAEYCTPCQRAIEMQSRLAA